MSTGRSRPTAVWSAAARRTSVADEPDGRRHGARGGCRGRGILDGHIVLTRKLATTGHFPAIDVLESISRVATAVVPPQQMADAREVRRLMGALRDVKELIEIGAYQTGSDALVDRAREAGVRAVLMKPSPPERLVLVC